MSALLTEEKQKWTYQAYRTLNDDRRYEVIEGELRMAPAPELGHQAISRDLAFAIWPYVKEKQLGKVFYAPCDVVLDKHNVVQPDLIFVSNENAGILKKDAIHGSPDLIVEIISPASIKTDRHTKKALYHKFGVREYWLIDPANKSVEVFTYAKNGYDLLALVIGEGILQSGVIEGFHLDVKEIFPPAETE